MSVYQDSNVCVVDVTSSPSPFRHSNAHRIWTSSPRSSTPSNSNNNSNTLPRCHNSARKLSTRRRLQLNNTEARDVTPTAPATTQIPRRMLKYDSATRRVDASPLRYGVAVELYMTSDDVTSRQVSSNRDATKRLSRSADVLLDGVDWSDIVNENAGLAPLACDEELEKTLLAPDTPLHDDTADDIWNLTKIEAVSSDDDVTASDDEDQTQFELTDHYAFTDDDALASDAEQSVTSSDQAPSVTSSSGVMSASTVSSSSSTSSFFSRSMLAATTRSLRSKVRNMTSSFRVATNPALRHLRFKSWRRRARSKGVSGSSSSNSFSSQKLQHQTSLLGNACSSDSQVNDVIAQMAACDVCSGCQQVRDAGVTMRARSSSSSGINARDAIRRLCSQHSSQLTSSAMTSHVDRDRFMTLPK